MSGNHKSTAALASWRIATILGGGVMALAFALLMTANVADAACTVASTGGADYNTISAALSAGCTTIDVAPGSYDGPVLITHAVTLNGANAGINPVSGTRGDESVISSPNGQAVIDINASDVVVNGFTLTESAPATGSSGAYGIDIQTDNSGTVIANNVITNIVASGTSNSATAQAIYLVHGPDGVMIYHNKIDTVSGYASTKGVFIGDSNSTDPSDVVIVDGNEITNITSRHKGAYGVTVNNGSSPVGTTQNSALVIKNNDINNLTGGWVHAVGIEADAPDVTISGNSFSDLNSTGSEPPIAVWFESEDLSYASSRVNGNSFNFTDDSGVYGVAVDPGLSGGNVAATCNYWGSATGPSGVGLGLGAAVTSSVVFSPWSKIADGPCAR